MNHFWHDILPSISAEEVQRIQKLEPFDEYEEWNMKCAHYFIGMAVKVSDTNDDYSRKQMTWLSQFDEEKSKVLNQPGRVNCPDIGTRLDEAHDEFQSLGLNRRNHSSVIIDNCLYIFGGFGSSQDSKSSKSHGRLNDIIIYDLRDNVMKDCSMLSVKGSPPPPRIFHTSVAFDDLMLVFGGRSGPLTLYNDIHIFNTSSNTWSHMDVSGNIPTPRFRHTATLVSQPQHSLKQMVVFGGLGKDSTVLNCCYTLNCETREWSEFVLSGDIPPPRHSHSAVYLPDLNSILVYGGLDKNERALNDCYVICLDSGKCSPVTSDQGSLPLRYGHTCERILSQNNTVLFIGGVSNSQSIPYNQSFVTGVIEKRNDNFTINWNFLSVTDKEKPTKAPMLVNHTTCIDILNPDDPASPFRILTVGGGGTCFSFGGLFEHNVHALYSKTWPDFVRAVPDEAVPDDKRLSSTRKPSTHQHATCGAFTSLPRILKPTESEWDNIYAAKMPVVISGLDIGRAPQLWTKEYLKDKIGSKKVNLTGSHCAYSAEIVLDRYTSERQETVVLYR
jgi:tRNA wybutosine-synthesizing protein 4